MEYTGRHGNNFTVHGYQAATSRRTPRTSAAAADALGTPGRLRWAHGCDGETARPRFLCATVMWLEDESKAFSILINLMS